MSQREDGCTSSRPARWAVVGGGMMGAVGGSRLRADRGRGGALRGGAHAGRAHVCVAIPVPTDRLSPGTASTTSSWAATAAYWPCWTRSTQASWNGARSRAACFAGGRRPPGVLGRRADRAAAARPDRQAADRIDRGCGRRSRPLRRRFDRITSARWLRRWSGRQATERLWLPLLRAKLGACAERASAVFIWSTIRRLVARGSRAVTATASATCGAGTPR